MRGCKWFTRGWTLQELIAPKNVEFYNASWTFLGTKYDFQSTISDITGIDQRILRNGEWLDTMCVAKRM
jgi:hypothetical protein